MDNKHPLKEYFKVFFLQPLPTIRISCGPESDLQWMWKRAVLSAQYLWHQGVQAVLL